MDRPHVDVRHEAVGTGSIWELNIIGFVLAVLAAVLLIGVAEGVAGKNKSHA